MSEGDLGGGSSGDPAISVIRLDISQPDPRAGHATRNSEFYSLKMDRKNSQIEVI